MRFFLSFLLAFSGFANAAVTEMFEICYQDVGHCVKASTYNGFVSSMILKADLYNTIDTATIQAFRAKGVTFQSVSTERYNRIKATTIQVASLRELLDDIEKMSDAEFSARLNGSACFVASVVCVGSIGAALATGGSAILLGAGACIGAAYPCLQSYQSWVKWQNEQDALIQESKAKEQAGGGAGAPSGGGGGGAPATGGQGGWYGPGGSLPPQTGGGVVTGSETPPGGGPGRRPIWQ